MKHTTFTRLITGALWLNVASFAACVALLWISNEPGWTGTLIVLSAFTLLGEASCAIAVWAMRQQQEQQVVDAF